MKTESKEIKDGVEGWVDERVRQLLDSLANPLEKKINLLRQRVETLQVRIHDISLRLDDERAARKKSTKNTDT